MNVTRPPAQVLDVGTGDVERAARDVSGDDRRVGQLVGECQRHGAAASGDIENPAGTIDLCDGDEKLGVRPRVSTCGSTIRSMCGIP